MWEARTVERGICINRGLKMRPYYEGVWRTGKGGSREVLAKFVRGVL